MMVNSQGTQVLLADYKVQQVIKVKVDDYVIKSKAKSGSDLFTQFKLCTINTFFDKVYWGQLQDILIKDAEPAIVSFSLLDSDGEPITEGQPGYCRAKVLTLQIEVDESIKGIVKLELLKEPQ